MSARYWRLHPAREPGDVVAEHDGGVGLDPDSVGRGLVSGPGNYTVTVRRRGKGIGGDRPVSQSWPIELAPQTLTGSSAPLRFNPGMARWFGLRLIEAAAICEAFDVEGGASPSVGPAEIQKLAEWMEQNAADWIGDGSAVDNAIRLMQNAKNVLAGHPDSGPPALTGTLEATGDRVSVSVRDLVIGRLRDSARKVIEEQSAPAALEYRAVQREAIAAGMITAAEITSDVIGYFTPNEQTILRGRVDI